MKTTAFAGACMLALGAPFELTTPIVRLPWQSVSNLELLLAIACGAWLVSLIVSRRGPAWQTPLTGPWIALLVAMFVAAVLAPANRVNAIHMAMRFMAAAVVFLMTVDGTGTPARLRRVTSAALIAAAVVAVLAILEYFRAPLVLQALRAFRPGLSLVGTQVRAGGSLAYPTIASMYFEIVFALGLGLLLTAVDANRRAVSFAVFVALVVIAYAVTLTFTRAGVATIAVSLAIVGGARYARRGSESGTRMVAALALAVVALVATSRSTQAMWLRFTSEGQGAWYRASGARQEPRTAHMGFGRRTAVLPFVPLAQSRWHARRQLRRNADGVSRTGRRRRGRRAGGKRLGAAAGRRVPTAVGHRAGGSPLVQHRA